MKGEVNDSRERPLHGKKNRPNWTKREQATSQEEIPLSLDKMSLSTDPGTFPEGNESV